MNAQIIDFPGAVVPVEWRIEVSSREVDSATCTYIPEGTYRAQRSANWLLWVHATTIDSVPALVERAQLLLKREQAIKRRV